MRGILLVWLWLAGVTGAAQGSDVGLVSMVSGDALYAPASGASGKIVPFMRLREGDRVELAAGAAIRVVLFGMARQEYWEGPAGFRVAKEALAPISGRPPQVSHLPAAVPQRLAHAPELVRNAKLGGIVMRGGSPTVAIVSVEARAELDEARAHYAAMKRDLTSDDIAAELYLFVAIEGMKLGPGERPQDLEALRTQAVREMLHKQPGNDEVRALAARLRVTP